LARRFGWHFLDSGALYRLTALAATRRGVAFDDEPGVAAVAAGLDVVFQAGADGVLTIILDNQDVTDDIRTEEAGNNASKVATLSPVREALLQRQRDFAKAPGLVADGRDMGTTVFPLAGVKIFLTASAEVRAQRRYKQLKEKGFDANLDSLIEEIEQRDERDRSRATSPLRPAEDAVCIDTSSKSIDEVLNEVLSHCTDFAD
jgi:cytidylate kinase